MATPFIVYKYRDWKEIYQQNTLTKREIFLASPDDINDPFDCTIHEDLSLLDTNEKREKYVDKYVIEALSGVAYEEEYLQAMRQRLILEIENNPKKLMGKYDLVYKIKGNRYFGIFSTSLIWDNIQMWSYYAKNHSGFCIGFDSDKLFNKLPSCRSAPIRYAKEFPRIDPLADNFIHAFESSHTKDINWKHEKEYRYFSNVQIEKKIFKSRIITLEKECFKELLIGLKFPEEGLNKIKRIAEDLEVPLFKITKSNSSFKLGRERI